VSLAGFRVFGFVGARGVIFLINGTLSLSCGRGFPPQSKMQRDGRRTAPQPPPPGWWPAGSAPSSSPQGLETRSRKRARTYSALSPSADSNGSLGAAVRAQRTTSRITTDYRGGTASAYKTWLQGIDPQTAGKPAYASYIGAKVAQHFDNTGFSAGPSQAFHLDPPPDVPNGARVSGTVVSNGAVAPSSSSSLPDSSIDMYNNDVGKRFMK
jgi:hypothetical protein